MFGFEKRRMLGRLLEPSDRPRPEHAAELEARLLERFDQVRTKKEAYKMKRFGYRKILVIAAVAALGIAACAAPADIDVDVGKSISIQFTATDGERPNPEAIVALIRGTGKVSGVGVRMMMRNDQATLDLEVWGEGLSEEPFADKIRKEFPALAKANIKEEVLEGKVRGNLGKKIGHDWLDLDVLDETDVEVAKQQIMKQLAAQGVQGKVDVEVKNEDGKHKVKVRVENEDCDPPDQKTAAPPPEGQVVEERAR